MRRPINALARWWFNFNYRVKIESMLQFAIDNGNKISPPFVNNSGDVVFYPVIGFNKKKVFVDIDGNLAYFYKSKFAFANVIDLNIWYERASRFEFTKKSVLLEAHYDLFRSMEGKSLIVRHRKSNAKLSILKFTMDKGRVLDHEDPPQHLPIEVEVGWINKIYYLSDLDIVVDNLIAS